MREMVLELEAAVGRGHETRGLDASDRRIVLEHIEELLVSVYDSYKEFEEVTGMIAGTLLSVSERAEKRAEKRAIAERDKFWAPKLEAERKQAEEKQKQTNIKLVRKLCAEGWQDIKIAETLDLDIETVRLYATL